MIYLFSILFSSDFLSRKLPFTAPFSVYFMLFIFQPFPQNHFIFLMRSSIISLSLVNIVFLSEPFFMVLQALYPSFFESFIYGYTHGVLWSAPFSSDPLSVKLPVWVISCSCFFQSLPHNHFRSPIF